VGYVPAHTASEIPGRGLQGLGDAYESGGVPLFLVSAENLFGVGIDRYLQISENDARVLFQKLGPLTVEVPDEVRVAAGPGRTKLLFVPGRQRLPAAFLTRFLFTLGLEADDIDLGGRHLAFWDAMFETFADDPDALAAAFRGAENVLTESDASAAEHAEFFAALAALSPEDRINRSLTVTSLEVPGNRLYAADTGELMSFIADVVGAGAVAEIKTRVQILNGNGFPGIGEEVATRLVGEGFRVILSGNAKRLDYEKTLIITYDSSPEGQALARRAQDLLGVGELQISTQDQGIVDLTIVVGKDFLRTP
nr:LCP family protein [Actinomycetota bacterium]